MKILIIGGTGLVGGKLIQRLAGQFEVSGTFSRKEREGLHHLEITRRDKVIELFEKLRPQVVIHTAALTHVDYCEQAQAEAWKINVEGTQNIVQACGLVGAKLIFISTDYIFDGQKGPYYEEDTPSPICWYGKTKLEGEKIIQEFMEDYLIIRTTTVFGFDPNSKNFVMQLLANYQNNQPMKVPTDQYGNPTLADNLAQAIEELIIKEKTGIYNIVGSTLMHRYDFALKACEILGLDEKLLIPVNTEDLQQKAKRPRKGGLRINKATGELETRLYSGEESLKIFKRQMRLSDLYNPISTGSIAV